MNERVAKLETLMDVVRVDMADLKKDVREVRETLARLDERVKHLPSKGFIVTAAMAALALLAALTLFQGKIQTFLGL